MSLLSPEDRSGRLKVILDEKITHDKKVFGYFEPYTKLINRWKSPYLIEFGHRLFVIQDRGVFILKYLIIDLTTDDKVSFLVIKDLK